MMDIYANAKELLKVQSMFDNIRHPSLYTYTILAKAYGRCNRPERAEEIVKSLLHNRQAPIHVDIEIINCLIDIWAESFVTYPNFSERAYRVYRWIYEDPKCKYFNILPNVITYTTLLKCITNPGSGRNDKFNKIIVQKLDVIFEDMNERFRSGDMGCKPDMGLYSSAVKACLRVNELQQADKILQQMEMRTSEFSTRPDIRTYGSILHSYAKLGTPASAKRTEEIHNQMRHLSQTMYPSLQPNVHTYNMVLVGWTLSGAVEAADRVWTIYEQMTEVDQIELDMFLYTTLITFLSKSKRTVDIERAMQLLQTMQRAYNQIPNSLRICPDGRHYGMILYGCKKTGDVDNAAQVMNMFVDAYLHGRCRLTDEPDSKIFRWIILTWIKSNDLVLATWFILDTVTAKMNMNSASSSIGPDYGTVAELRDAWVSSTHPDKDLYVAKIDHRVMNSYFLPSQERSLSLD
jgi:pentatricopeptide repeat protein